MFQIKNPYYVQQGLVREDLSDLKIGGVLLAITYILAILTLNSCLVFLVILIIVYYTFKPITFITEYNICQLNKKIANVRTRTYIPTPLQGMDIISTLIIEELNEAN